MRKSLTLAAAGLLTIAVASEAAYRARKQIAPITRPAAVPPVQISCNADQPERHDS